MTRVKFCGLTQLDEVELAEALNATYAGLVVQAPKSHRDLPLKEAAVLVEDAPVGLRTVMVTPSSDPDAVEQATSIVAPDVVQLTGDLPHAVADRLREAHNVEVWRAIALDADVDAAAGRLAGLQDAYEALLVDALAADGYGGTGHTVDWDTAADLNDRLGGYPIVLAGGLSPGNVDQAIGKVRPWCVDVSSGIETDERKDPAKMRAFAKAVRSQETPR